MKKKGGHGRHEQTGGKEEKEEVRRRARRTMRGSFAYIFIYVNMVYVNFVHERKGEGGGGEEGIDDDPVLCGIH